MAKWMSDPDDQAWMDFKRCLRYIKTIVPMKWEFNGGHPNKIIKRGVCRNMDIIPRQKNVDTWRNPVH